MSTLRQIAATTEVAVRGIPSRLGTSLVVIVGLAAVVAVFITTLAMAVGFTEAAVGGGSDARAIIVATGSNTEVSSALSLDDVATISNAPGIANGAEGKPLVSSEALAFVPVANRDTGLNAFVTVRGVGAEGFAVRPDIRLVEGRKFEAGKREVIVGRGARSRMPDLAVGRGIQLPDGDWAIVGAFESGGDAHESGLLTDATTLIATYRGNVNSMTVSLRSPAEFMPFKAQLTSDPSLSVDVYTEREYVTQASQSMSTMLTIVAFGVGGIMAFGAAVGALNTMYSAVSARSREIATLRAIGFGASAVVVSVLAEALFLALLGALIGSLVAWSVFNGAAMSTITGSTPSQLTFALRVTPELIALGVTAACTIGLLGGLLPAIRAGAVPVADALRAV
jgi:putative ABC transport system permease protein